MAAAEQLERIRPDWLVDTGQIAPGTALRLFAVAPLRLIAALAGRACACRRKPVCRREAMLRQTPAYPCSGANLPRSRLSQSGRKRSSQADAGTAWHRIHPGMGLWPCNDQGQCLSRTGLM